MGTFLLTTCELWNQNILQHLEHYTSSAGIQVRELDGSYPAINEITHLPAGNAKKIRFIMRNPQKYDLNFEVIWKNKPLGDTTPVEGVDYTLEQVEFNIMEMTLTPTFLDKLDSNPNYGDISAEITVQDQLTERKFEPHYAHTLIVNSPPSTPAGTVFLKHEDLSTWILAFNLSTHELRQAKDNDIRTVTINGETYSVDIDHTNGSYTVSGALTIDEAVIKENNNITLEDALGQLYYHNENTVYFKTSTETTISPSATLYFTDSRGLRGEETTVSTSGLTKNQYYVSSEGDDENAASVSKPLRTLQKAIDAITTNNDPNQTYAIFAKGDVGNGSIIPKNSAIHNIRIEGYDGGATIGELEINGSGTRLNIVNLVTIEHLKYASTEATVSISTKPTNQIKITVPANTENNTLLAKNNGANFTENDFNLTSESDSLFIQGGDLYYSTHKKVTWGEVTSSNSITEPGKTGFEPITITDLFKLEPATLVISFDDEDTTDQEKTGALTKALVQAFSGKIIPETHAVEPIEESDIHVSFLDSQVDIILRAKEGYTFNQASIELTKTVTIELSGDFNSYTKILWNEITTEQINKESGTAELAPVTITKGFSVDSNPITVNFHEDDLLVSSNQQLSIRNAITAALTANLPEGVLLPQERMSITRNSSNFKQATLDIILKANDGYIFTPEGKPNTDEITISIPLQSDADFGDIEIIDISTIGMNIPTDASSTFMVFDGRWTITNGEFISENETITLPANNKATYQNIATALQNAITGDNFTIAMDSPTDSDMPVGTTEFTATLTANPAYLFTGNKPSIPIEITFTLVKTIANTDIDISNIEPADNTSAGMLFEGSWTITDGNFVEAAQILKITADKTLNEELLKTALSTAITKVITINGIETEPTISLDSQAVPGDIGMTATLHTLEHYIFEDKTTSKTINIGFASQKGIKIDGINGNAVNSANANFSQISQGETVNIDFNDTLITEETKISALETALVISFNENVQAKKFAPITTNDINVTPQSENTTASVTINLSAQEGYFVEGDSAIRFTATASNDNGFKTLAIYEIEGLTQSATTNYASISNFRINSSTQSATVNGFNNGAVDNETTESTDIRNSVAKLFNANNPASTNDINANDITLTLTSPTSATATFTPNPSSTQYYTEEISLNLSGVVSTFYYVSNANDSDLGDNRGVSARPFESVQAAVNKIKTANTPDAGITHNFTILVAGEIIEKNHSELNTMIAIFEIGKPLNLTMKGKGTGSQAGIIDATSHNETALYINDAQANITMGANLTITGGKKISGYGGGVSVNSGSFTMAGGTISGNSADYGGGVAVTNSGTFTMTGGIIEKNIAFTKGGGIYNYVTPIKISGTPVIHNNTLSNKITNSNLAYDNSNYPIQVIDSLQSGAIIQITAKDITEGNEVAKLGDSYTTLKESDRAAFYSDSSSRIFLLSGNEIVENRLVDIDNRDNKNSIQVYINTAVNNDIPTTFRVNGTISSIYDLTINDSSGLKAKLTIQGYNASSPGIFNASSLGRVLHIIDANVVLGSNFTITGGAQTPANNSNHDSSGAGVQLEGGSLTMIANSKITGCTVKAASGNDGSSFAGKTGRGGGVYINNGATLTLKDTASITENSVTGGTGARGADSVDTNWAADGSAGGVAYGGGVHVENGNLILMDNATIRENSVTGGAGGRGGDGKQYNTGHSSSGGEGKIAGSGKGGGVYLAEFGKILMYNSSKIESNTATGGKGGDGGHGGYHGGGVGNSGEGRPAGAGGVAHGGGIFIGNGNSISHTIIDSNVKSNKVKGGDGGIGGNGGNNDNIGGGLGSGGKGGAAGTPKGSGYLINDTDEYTTNNTTEAGTAGKDGTNGVRE